MPKMSGIHARCLTKSVFYAILLCSVEKPTTPFFKQQTYYPSYKEGDNRCGYLPARGLI